MFSSYFVYAIGKSVDLIHPYHHCYIGVTNNLTRRWRDHTKSKYTVGIYIREHNLSNENMICIFEGHEKDCFEMELKLRPYPLMGLNESCGGNGGKTIYSYDRGQKISRKVKLARRNKYWSSHKKGTFCKTRNPNAKNWILISPDDTSYQISGNLESFCVEHNLLLSSLRYYEGRSVPDLIPGFGGFRKKSDNSLRLRESTINWTLVRAGG